MTSFDENWSDDDDIYDADCAELSQKVHTDPIQLFEPTSQHREGATKATIEGKPTGSNVYHKLKSDCSISITRLLWVDGWRTNGCGEAMTLVVLRLGFKPAAENARVAYASVQLKLKSDSKKGDDPKLVAWGPFRHPEFWNGIQVHKRNAVTLATSINAGGTGLPLSVESGVDSTREMEWDQPFSDYGSSSEVFSKDRVASPNGVLWQVHQNARLRGGITPEVRVAALFSRPDHGNYRAAVRIIANTGTADNLIHRGLKAFGKHGGDKIFWRVTAHQGNKDNCHFEGNEICEGIDLNNLGKLIDPKDSMNLDPVWLNKWDRVETTKMIGAAAVPKPTQSRTELSTAGEKVATGTTASSPGLEREDTLTTETRVRHASLETMEPIDTASTPTHNAGLRHAEAPRICTGDAEDEYVLPIALNMDGGGTSKSLPRHISYTDTIYPRQSVLIAEERVLRAEERALRAQERALRAEQLTLRTKGDALQALEVEERILKAEWRILQAEESILRAERRMLERERGAFQP